MTTSPPSESKCSPIPILLRPGSPIAIVRCIIAIVVSSLKHHFRLRSKTNVFEECCKRISPSRTNFNTSSSIAFVIRILRVLTSSNHRAPRVILNCASPSMSSEPFNTKFFIQASARACRSLLPHQRTLVEHFFSSAFTSAKPSFETVSRFGLLDDCQPAEFPSCLIGKWFWHPWNWRVNPL